MIFDENGEGYSEIKIKLTDMNLREYEETILFPNMQRLREYTDGDNFVYIQSPEACLLEGIGYLRLNVLEAYQLKSGNIYTPRNILRINIDGDWVKI